MRGPKKSETLEVRLPHPTKTAFMARCRDDGVSASEAVRAFIEARLEPPPRRPAAGGWKLAMGGLIAAAVAAAAVPSLARTDPPSAFRGLDRNADGQLSPAEVARLDADGDGVVSLAEFQSATRR